MYRRHEVVARIVKARGLEGKVLARAGAGLPLSVYEGLACHVVPPTLYGPRDITLDVVEYVSDDEALVSFRGLACRDDAEQLVGRYLLAACDDIEEDDGLREDGIIGMRVLDERYGELGEVCEYIETGANDVIVVRGAYGEVLVPVIDSCIVSVPQTSDEPLVTHVMDGLVEQAGDER